MGHKFMVGVISYLADELDNLDKRIAFHKEQLRWLESLDIDFDLYRVESAWGMMARGDGGLIPNRDARLFNQICVGKQPPGANRNQLLSIFYDSDYDWLVCMDDDRMLYPHYDPRQFFLELDTPQFTALAEQGYMLLCLDPIYMPFKKENYAWQYHETHWKFDAVSPEGGLQICFIPNLRKYGYKEIFFDSESYAQSDEAPEDYKFKLDWLIAKHRLIRCSNLIMKEIGQASGDGSTLYADLAYRREVEETQKTWYANYMRERLPRNPELWKKGELNRRRNPKFTQLVSRSVPYVFKDKELPR